MKKKKLLYDVDESPSLSKKIILAISSLGILTACGPDYSIPSSYKRVDMNNRNELTIFEQKLSDADAITSKQMSVQTEIDFSLEMDEFLICSGDLLSYSSSIRIANVNCDLKYTFAKNGISFKDRIEILEIKDLSFNLEMTNNKQTISLKANDVDFCYYLVNGNLYWDASDSDLKKFVYAILDLDTSSTALKEMNALKANLDSFFGKYYIENAENIIDVEDFSLSSITDNLDNSFSYQNIINSLISSSSSYDIGDSFILAYDENSKGVAFGISSNNLDLSKYKDIKKYDCEMGVVFNEEGLLERAAFSCDLDLSNGSNIILIDDAEFTLNLKYDNIVPVVPNFKKYEPFSNIKGLEDLKK